MINFSHRLFLSALCLAGLTALPSMSQAHANKTRLNSLQKSQQQHELKLPLNEHGFIMGTKDGGGGKVAVCRNADNSIKSVELLDVWEARSIYQRQIPQPSGTLEQMVADGIQRMKNVILFNGSTSDSNGNTYTRADALAIGLQDLADPFLGKHPRGTSIRRLKGVHLNPTDDSFEIATPEGCQIEQIVVYLDSGLGNGDRVALINQDLYEHLDITNQTALILHEALYATMRYADGEPTSIRVRRAVGYVMAGGSFNSFEKLLQFPVVYCWTAEPPLSDLFIYQSASTGNLVALTSYTSDQVGMGFVEMDLLWAGSSAKSAFERMNDLTRGFGFAFQARQSPVDYDVHSFFAFNFAGSAGFTMTPLKTNNPNMSIPPASQAQKMNCELRDQP